MALLRQKRRKLILTGMIGFLTGAVPMAFAGGICLTKYIVLSNEMSDMKEEYKAYNAYILDEDKKREEEVSEEDIKKIVYYSKEDLGIEEELPVRGILRMDGYKGMVLTKDMVYENTETKGDIRMYFIDYVYVPENVCEGMMLDIRIVFPNGEDYVVVKGKTIQSRTEEGIYINATERERLMLSSAYTDMLIYKGTKIYGSIYPDEYKELSVVDYPLNMYVAGLAKWNPNLTYEIDNTQDTEKRQILEANLYEFMGTDMNGMQGIVEQ